MTVVIVSAFQTLYCRTLRKQRENTIIIKRYPRRFFCIFLENITLGENFSVELTFRTSTRDGILFVILGNSTTEAGELIRCPKLCLIPSQQIKNRERMRVSYFMSAKKYVSVSDVIGLRMKPLRSEVSLNFCLNLLKGEKQTSVTLFFLNSIVFLPGLPPPPFPLLNHQQYDNLTVSHYYRRALSLSTMAVALLFCPL